MGITREIKLSFKEQVLLNAIYNFNIENPGQNFSFSNKQIAEDIFYLEPSVYNSRYVSRILGCLVSKELVKCVYIYDNPRNKRLDIVLTLTEDQIQQLIKEKEKFVDDEYYLVLEQQNNSSTMLETFLINQSFCFKYKLDFDLGAIMSFLWLIHNKKLKTITNYVGTTPDEDGWFFLSNKMLDKFLPNIFINQETGVSISNQTVENLLDELVCANLIEIKDLVEVEEVVIRKVKLAPLGRQYFNKF